MNNEASQLIQMMRDADARGARSLGLKAFAAMDPKAFEAGGILNVAVAVMARWQTLTAESAWAAWSARQM